MMSASSSWLFLVIAGAFGLAIGSFVNVVIYRGPALWGLAEPDSPRGGLATPGSYCPSCRAPIPPWGLIPLASFAFQNGRCRKCNAPISLRYPIVEALGGLAAVASVATFGLTPGALCAAVFLFTLIALAFIDYDIGYLPDALTLPLIGAGLTANAFGLFVSLKDAAIAAATGYAAFRLIGYVFKKLREREGLGQGDAKLIAAIGAWCGWTLLPATIFSAAAITLFAILIAGLRGANIKRNQEIPFGPALCIAGAASIFILRYAPF